MKPASYPHLFEPGRIGTLEVKNRIVKSPQGVGMGNRDGSVSERTIRHYRRLAQGGSGLVMIAAAHFDPTITKSFHGQLLLTDDEYIAGLAWLAETIHAHGAKAGLQLEHCGRQNFLGKQPVKAPSVVPWPAMYDAIGLVPEELTVPEIEATVGRFGDAARRAVLAGFDLVEIHGAHGYLITNFLSPHTNKRTDHYGGPLENRMRFLCRVIEDIRAKVPAAFPVTMRISGTDYEPDGIPIEETVEVCQTAQRLGLDAVHVSGGDHHTMIYQVAPMLMPRALHVWAADAIRQAVSVPVIASGSITLPALAEEILASGKADFVSLGRPLLADPFWPAKARQGRPGDIRPCIRCNDGCLDRSLFRFRAVACSVNPVLGHEEEFEVGPAAERRRVAVVGGGPAGLEAARVLCLRGHEVVLYEKRKLGGLLNEASAPEFKSDLRPYLDYLVEQARKHGVEIVEQEATTATIEAGGYDTVVIASGGRPRPLGLPGEHDAALVPALEALGLSGRVVVVGGGLTGTETALVLAGAGAGVTLVEAGAEIMRGDPITDRITYGMRLAEEGVTVLTSSPVVGLPSAGVVVEAKRGREDLPADHVVVAAGRDPDPALAEELREAGREIHVIGDAAASGRIHDAVHAAFLTARTI
jgi:2,4-dienoyl-CoA reductase-like NADH-dependent reductase (Old Yellow Enzyme family)/thioredoxin reductase